MDGYAVRAADVAAAGAHTPVQLRILEVVGAGSVPRQTVTAGSATQIMTGSPMPDGADAVVRVEDTAGARGRGAHPRQRRCRRQRPRSGRGHARRRDRATAGPRFAPGGSSACWPRWALPWCACAAGRRWRSSPPATSWSISGSRSAPDRSSTATPTRWRRRSRRPVACRACWASSATRPEATRSAFADAFGSDMVLSTGGVSMGTFDLVRETLARARRRRALLEGRAEARQAAHLRRARARAGLRLAGQPGVVAGVLLPLRAAGVARDEGPRRGCTCRPRRRRSKSACRRHAG